MIIDFASHRAELTPEGAVFFADLGILVVADLHFEKGSFFQRISTFLPPYDSFETLQKLERVIERFKPTTLIAAGDSFHDKRALERMTGSDLAYLHACVGRIERWIWLAGNHDPSLHTLIEGTWLREHAAHAMIFRHRAEPGARFEITGHYHPKIRLRIRGHRIAAPCFLRFGEQLILPSFGRFTGGLDIESDVLKTLTEGTTRNVFALTADRVFAV